MNEANYIFAPVQKKQERVVSLVIDSIKEALLSERLRPGDRLPSVTELSESMNVGISSVREAIKVLEGLGVIESRQGKGTFVCTDLKQDTINAMTFQMLVLPRTTQALIEFRIMYETAYTLMAIENATQEDLDHLETIVSALERKIQVNSAAIEIQDEMDFHVGVLMCTHNPYVIRLGETMLELILTSLRKEPTPTEKYCVPKDHRRILEAIKARDKERLIKELQLNFQGWKEKYFE